MSKDNDILHEAKRLRLLAAALELQHFTSGIEHRAHPGRRPRDRDRDAGADGRRRR